MSNKKFSVVLVLVMLFVAATLTAGPMGNRFTQLPAAATSATSTETTSTTPITPAGYGRGYGATLANETDSSAFAARQAQMLEARNSVPDTECLDTGEAPVLGGRMMQGQVAGNLSARGNVASQQPMGRGGVANQLPQGRGNVASQQPMGRGGVANQLPAAHGNMVNQMPAARGAGQGRSR